MNVLPLHWCLPNLDRAGLGRISEKWPDSGFAGAGAEMWYKPSYLV